MKFKATVILLITYFLLIFYLVNKVVSYIIDIPASDLWDIFIACVPRFEWAEAKDGSTKKTASSKSKPTGKDVSKSTKKSGKPVLPVGVENMKDGDRYVMLNCCSPAEAAK